MLVRPAAAGSKTVIPCSVKGMSVLGVSPLKQSDRQIFHSPCPEPHGEERDRVRRQVRSRRVQKARVQESMRGLLDTRRGAMACELGQLLQRGFTERFAFLDQADPSVR